MVIQSIFHPTYCVLMTIKDFLFTVQNLNHIVIVKVDQHYTETYWSKPLVSEFKVTVQTADKKFAGTDANVFITLYGKKGSSLKQKLEQKGKNLFEGGSKDSFTFVTKDLGAITSIK